MRDDKKYVVFNLRETYHELGEYDFKIVLSPNMFKNSHDSEFDIIDADGKQMEFSVRKWGRKMNCVFKIDERVPDGVSTIKMSLVDSSGGKFIETIAFWVVKP